MTLFTMLRGSKDGSYRVRHISIHVLRSFRRDEYGTTVDFETAEGVQSYWIRSRSKDVALSSRASSCLQRLRNDIPQRVYAVRLTVIPFPIPAIPNEFSLKMYSSELTPLLHSTACRIRTTFSCSGVATYRPT